MLKPLLSVALLVAIAGSAVAQGISPQCPSGTTVAGIPDRQRATQDACQQAIDLFKFMVPQLGIAMAGGNATLGVGGTLGGLGHFSVGIRGNVLQGSVPQVDRATPTTSINGAVQRTNYPTKDQFLGLPAVDASVGIFKGIPLGLTNVGGVDLLLSASYIPNYDAGQVKVETDNPLKIGYGVRIGALQESLLLPGVSVTYLKRDLPKTTITGTMSGASVTVRDLDVQTSAWRIVASKSLILFTVAAGVGKDNYDASTVVQGTVSPPISPISQTSDAIKMDQDLTRTNYFADLGFNFLLAKILAEIGTVSGGTIQTYNKFDTAPDKSRLYGSLGLRLSF
jgi:hypothetical protein